MSSDSRMKSPFPSALESAETVRRRDDAPTCDPASYSLAYQDTAFLLRDELRPVRLQLELLKPEIILQEQHIESTVVIYGSARIPDPETAEANLVSAQADYRKNNQDAAMARRVDRARKALENSKYYEEARKLGTLISRNTGKDKLVVLLHEEGYQVSTSMVGTIIVRLRDRGVLREPVRNHVSAHKRVFKRPYAVRRPKEIVNGGKGFVGKTPDEDICSTWLRGNRAYARKHAAAATNGGC